MIRITTFNIASSFGKDKKSDWRRGADVLKRIAPDAVSCNEVSVHEDFEPDLDIPVLYGEYLGMTPVFGRATSRDVKGDYGGRSPDTRSSVSASWSFRHRKDMNSGSASSPGFMPCSPFICL